MRNYFPLTVRCQKRECNRKEFAQQSATDFFYSPLHNSRNQSRRKSASVIQIDGSLLDVTRHGNGSDGGKEEKDLHDKHRPSADNHRMSIPLNCPFPDPVSPPPTTVSKLLNWETRRGLQFNSLRFFLLCKSFDLLHFKSATGAAKKDRLCTLCESRLYGSYPCIVKFSRPISKTAKPKQYFQAQYEHKQARIKHHGAAVTTKWRRIEAYGQRIICVMTRTR